MRRIAFYLFYDEHGVVDDYIVHKLTKLREHVDTIFVISNSAIDAANREKIDKVCDIFQERQNIGFDVWAYKEAMETFGHERLNDYDELILLNYTFFGPIFPFSELFSSMENKVCDFWGISAHKEVKPNPYSGEDRMPLHIQSHFIAVRKPMFTSTAFRDYWDNMPMITSYNDSILRHETRFTEHFHQQGFSYEIYLNPDDYSTDYALFSSLEESIQNRCPILKKRIFVHDPIYLEQNAIFPRRAMEYIEQHTDYQTDLIWKSVTRAAEPRTLYTNADMFEILSDSSAPLPPVSKPRIAVIAHMYYSDMMGEVMGHIDNIPYPFDLYITTDSEQKKAEIESVLAGFDIRHLEIRLISQNQGRDMAPMFVTCRDILLSEKYDYICRLHSKKSPQDNFQVAQNFKRHMYENLLFNREYVANLIDLFDKQPQLGVVMAPVINIGYGTLGHSWSINREITTQWAAKLGIRTIFDASTPLAPYGGMYWFRTAALRKMASYPWSMQDFEKETGKVDGTLPHALERLIAYAAFDSGYYARCVMNRVSAAVGYTKLEYKLQRLAAVMPSGDVRAQLDWLHLVNAHLFGGGQQNYSIRRHIEICVSLVWRSMSGKFPKAAVLLRPIYGACRAAYRRIFGFA